MNKNFTTAEGFEKIKQELERLRSKRKGEITERLKQAKEFGDLSENAEYFEAQEEQARIENRIAELEELIKNTTIIQKAPAGGMVKIGSTIEVFKDGAVKKFTIVGSNEANPEEGLISNESPLGKAFLGCQVDDEVEVETPRGKVRYKILSIQ